MASPAECPPPAPSIRTAPGRAGQGSRMELQLLQWVQEEQMRAWGLLDAARTHAQARESASQLQASCKPAAAAVDRWLAMHAGAGRRQLRQAAGLDGAALTGGQRRPRRRAEHAPAVDQRPHRLRPQLLHQQLQRPGQVHACCSVHLPHALLWQRHQRAGAAPACGMGPACRGRGMSEPAAAALRPAPGGGATHASWLRQACCCHGVRGCRDQPGS
jgi:hypothetical protein